MASSFSPEEIAYMKAHINEDERPRQIIIFSVLIFVATTAVALRFVARAISPLRLWWDDYMCVVGLVTACGFAGDMIMQAQLGTGLHIIRVPKENVTKIIKLTYAIQLIYPVTLTATKLSILLLYWRLFPNKKFRVAVWVVGIFTVAWCVEILIASIFQCTPVSFLWTHQGDGHCFPVRGAFAIANAIPNIGVDIVLLIMPIRLVWSLNTGRREKMGVTIMFILGGFVAVVSIVRFVILATGNLKVGDVTWNTVEFHIWTTVEPTIAVVCACLPTLKPIFFWGKARVKGSTDASASKSFSKSRSGSFSKNTWPESFSHNSDTDATSLSALEQGRAPREQPWEASMLGNSKVRGHFKNKATSAAVPVGPEETGQEQELPLGLIEVRKDVDWSENKPANR